MLGDDVLIFVLVEVGEVSRWGVHGVWLDCVPLGRLIIMECTVCLRLSNDMEASIKKSRKNSWPESLPCVVTCSDRRCDVWRKLCQGVDSDMACGGKSISPANSPCLTLDL